MTSAGVGGGAVSVTSETNEQRIERRIRYGRVTVDEIAVKSP